MTKKEIVEMVSKLLSFAADKPEGEVKKEDVPVVEAEMTKVTTKDGLVLETPEKFDVGVAVMIEGLPAPDATYELEDGSKITTVEGLVTEILAIEAPKVEEEVGMTEQSFTKQLKERDDKFSALELKFNKVLEATIMLSEAFNKLPVTDKIVINATSTNSEQEFARTPMTKKQRNLKEIKSVLEEIRNDQNKNNK